MPQLISLQRQGLQEQTVLREEGWSQAESLQEKGERGHAQWPVLFIKLRHLVQKKGAALVEGLLLALALALVLAVAWAAAGGATPSIMCLMMTASQADPPSASTCTPLRMMTTDISIIPTRAILFSPPLPLQKWRRVSVPPKRELRQQSKIHVSHLVSLFQIGN